jgi:hypothetical protein
MQARGESIRLTERVMAKSKRNTKVIATYNIKGGVGKPRRL